jgi:hypothetical protein
MSDHPFGPFGGGSSPGDPLNANPEEMKVCCPKCKSQNFRAWTNQYGLFRSCYDCKNEWSGGTSGGLPDPFNAGSSGSPPGVAAPDADDIPVQAYTGPEFNPYGDDY